ncbi:CHAT domain-containing protein [Aspergillus foveolatus]|uniref:CHAT domain-containing protein n=1 Tax=Aspergillus foveolatus TaxID=210207 RepID=UPI003CCCBB29
MGNNLETESRENPFAGLQDEDYERLIPTVWNVIEVLLAGEPGTASWHFTQGRKLWVDHEKNGSEESLQAAVANMQKALDLTPKDDKTVPEIQANLGGMLLHRYQTTGSINDLESAQRELQGSISGTPADSEHRAGILMTMALVMRSRYERMGVLSDLQSAAEHAQMAIKAAPAEGRKQARIHIWLASVLRSLYERTGAMADMERSLDHARTAVQLHAERGEAKTVGDVLDSGKDTFTGAVSTLANILYTRYLRTGDTRDLDEALLRLHEALAAVPEHELTAVDLQGNLANMLRSRYDRQGKDEDLNEAIRLAKKALDLTPGNHQDRAMRLSSLASIMSGLPSFLDVAITHTQEAIVITPEDHTDRPMWMTTLANRLIERYNSTRSPDTLEQAIEWAEKAADSTPSNHPDLTLRLNNLAAKIQRRGPGERDEENRDLALGLYIRAFECSVGAPSDRIHAARRAVELLVRREEWSQAHLLAERAMRIVPTVCSRQLSRDDQQYAMSQMSGLAADACSLALRASDYGAIDDGPTRAIQYVEHGRGLIIRYLIEGKEDLSGIDGVSPQLANEIERLRYKAFLTIRPDEHPAVREQLAREREKAAAELDGILQGISQTELTAEQLNSCADEGPIVIVNVSDIGSDALIISPTLKVLGGRRSSISRLKLPQLQGSQIMQYRAFGIIQGGTRHAMVVGNSTAGVDNSQQLRTFLAWLWSSCVRPVLEELGFANAPQARRDASMVDTHQLPRIWWIGTGLAANLPFHAAGIHSLGSTHESILSYAVSSYTPTIKALRHARKNAALTTAQAHRVLMATMSRTPGMADLPGVEKEATAIGGVISHPHQAEQLPQPSVEDVLQRLQQCTVAHFACHGASDFLDPARSFLALQGPSTQEPDRLTVQKVLEADLGRAYLAYLSACSTADSQALKLADEALHLASSFQVAGFGHVVASMRRVNDTISAKLAGVFYRNLLRADSIEGNRAVADALHDAVTAIRSSAYSGMNLVEHPLYWAQYVHFGA